MTTDYRALCAALLDEIGHESPTTCLARAALAQPESVGPTDEELAQLIYEKAFVPAAGHCKTDAPPWVERGNSLAQGDARECARAVLQRWGRPALAPIPVSERLPRAEDCAPEGSDAVGCCWLWEPDINGHEPLGAWKLEHKDWASDGDATHWLPFHALPLTPTT